MKKVKFVGLVLALIMLFSGFVVAADEIKIGVSLPTQEVDRWVRDKDNLIEFADEMDNVELLVQIANNDAVTQINQVENLLTQGIDVLICAPHDATSIATAVESAKASGVPVIGYVRLIKDTDFEVHMSYNNREVGELQGKYLAENVPEGNYVLLGGSKTDANAFLFRNGAMDYIQPLIDEGKVNVVMDQFINDWRPELAMNAVENALTNTGNDVDAVLCPNDGLAGGAIQALAAQGLAGEVAVTGGDAELAAAKRVVEGTQSMTVYRDLKKMDKMVLEIAVKLAKGEDISEHYTGTIDNDYAEIPAVMPKPVMVTQENIDEVLIESGYHSREEVYEE